jgi:hypothetical protein
MKKKISYLLYDFIAILFVFFCYAEYVLARDGNIFWNIGWIFKVLIVSILGGTAAGSLLCFMLYKAEEKWKNKTKKKEIILPEGKKLFAFSWVITLLCWMPGFLAYYPGINAYDFTIQLEQITFERYNAHHPLAHTLLVEGFIRFGNWIGSGTLGLAAYVILQMCVLSAALATGILFLRKRNVRALWLIILQILSCIMPSHLYMSLSVTKDTLFTAFIMLFVITLCALIEKRAEKVKIGWTDAGYVGFGVLAILFRNNAIYAIGFMAAFLPVFVIFEKKARGFWMKILGETVVALVAGSIVLSALFQVTDAVQGDKREMLSIPIQQLARTMVYHGGIQVIEQDDNSMDEADKALINEFILYEAYRDYKPAISDPVKGKTNTYVFVYRMKDFLKTYINLFIEYPSDYINAFLALIAGYVSPFDETHAHINEHPGVYGMGYIQTLRYDEEAWDIFIDSKMPKLLEKMEYFADQNMYLNIPGLNVLMVPGIYFWAFLIVAVWLLVHKKTGMLIPFTMILGYFATLFFGPTVQMRYIYPVMTVLPYLSIWAVNQMYKEK